MTTHLLTLALALAGAGPDDKPPTAAQLLEVHRADAETYTFYRDPARTQKLTLRKEPVYRWTNPTRNDGQTGDVFIWTYRGRPEVVGCIFSHPVKPGRRAVNHEFHSLSPNVLLVERPGDHAEAWEPKAPGVDWSPLGGPEPAATPAARRSQLTALARSFAGESHLGGPSVRLRLLPTPLYRYESDDPDVLDGALFAYATDAGTDPEILLVIEAHRDATGKPAWFSSGARFSDWALRLTREGREAWSSPGAAIGGYAHDEGHRYRFYNDRIIDELPAPGPK